VIELWETYGYGSFASGFLRSLGGPEKVENLRKRETIAAIQVMVEFQGVIGH
jgi:hypothetical protein